MLATKDGRFSRVAVFCDRRDKKDDGGGPSAQGVKEEIEKLAKGDRKAGRALALCPVHLELPRRPEAINGNRRVVPPTSRRSRLLRCGWHPTPLGYKPGAQPLIWVPPGQGPRPAPHCHAHSGSWHS